MCCRFFLLVGTRTVRPAHNTRWSVRDFFVPRESSGMAAVLSLGGIPGNGRSRTASFKVHGGRPVVLVRCGTGGILVGRRWRRFSTKFVQAGAWKKPHCAVTSRCSSLQASTLGC